MLRSSRIWVLCCLLAATTACDRVVKDGEMVTLGGRGSVFGVNTPNAAFVLPGGTLIVSDADLFGRGAVVDTLPAGPFPTPGAGIVATGGIVQVLNGLVAGGGVLVRLGDPSTLPPAASIPGPNVLAPALLAAGSVVDIAGGTLASSAVGGNSLDPYGFSPALIAVSSGVLIRGGTFRTGTRPGAVGIPLSVDASNSNVLITDGSFDGVVQLSGSTAEISGGFFSIGLLLGKSDPGTIPVGPGCTDIRGGTFSFGIDVRGVGEQVFIFGNSFDRGFGPLPIPQPPASRQQFVITGTRLDGSALRLDVLVDAGTQVVLAAPGDAGCGEF